MDLDITEKFKHDKKTLFWSLMAGLMYFAGMFIAMNFTGPYRYYSIFYIPAGISLGFATFLGLRILPFIFVAKLVYVTAFLHWEPNEAALSCIGSILEIIVGWFIYDSKRFNISRFGEQIDTLIIAIISPIMATVIGVWSLNSIIQYDLKELFYNFFIYYIGDVLGILIILPLFIHIKERKEIKLFDFIVPLLAITTSFIFFKNLIAPLWIGFLFAIILPYFLGTSFGMYLTILSLGFFYNWAYNFEVEDYENPMMYNDVFKIFIFILTLILVAVATNKLKKLKNTLSIVKTIGSIWPFILTLFYFVLVNNTTRYQDIISNKLAIYNGFLSETVEKYRYLIKANEYLLQTVSPINKKRWVEIQKETFDSVNDPFIVFQGLKVLDNGEFYFYQNPKLPPVDFGEFEVIFNSKLFTSYANLAVNDHQLVFSPSFKYKNKRYSFFVSANRVKNEIHSVNIIAIDLEKFLNQLLSFNFKSSNYDIYEIWHNNQKQLIFQNSKSADFFTQKFNGPVSEISILNRKFQVSWNSSLRSNIRTGYYPVLILLLGAILTLEIAYILYRNQQQMELMSDDTKKQRPSNIDFIRYLNLFNHTNDVVIEFDHSKIISANKKALEFFHLDESHLNALSPEDLIHLRSLSFDSMENNFTRYLIETNLHKIKEFESFIVVKGQIHKIKAILTALHNQKSFSYLLIFKEENEEKPVNREKPEAKLVKFSNTKEEILNPSSKKTDTPLPLRNQNIFENKRVLLVEDNRINIFMTKKFLEQWGITVDVAENGQIAVDKVKANGFYDLVLMDLHMPVMDGFQATILIKELYPQLTVIALTADVLINIKDNYSYFDYFISKPFKMNEFLDILKQFLNKDKP